MGHIEWFIFGLVGIVRIGARTRGERYRFALVALRCWWRWRSVKLMALRMDDFVRQDWRDTDATLYRAGLRWKYFDRLNRKNERNRWHRIVPPKEQTP